jgi:hypothetical protein
MNDKEKISKYLDYKGISKYKFYTQTGLSNGFLDSGKSFSLENTRIILDKYHDLNPNWLLLDQGEMIQKETSSLNIVSEPQESYGNKNLVPIFDIYATAGEEYGAVTDHPSEFIDPGDLFRDADALIRVYGDSMGAGYQSGSFVPIRKLKNKMLIVPGFDYIIETSEYRVLKTIRKSSKENHILACSLNDDVYEKGELAGKMLHEPFEICFDDIISISIAVGNVRRNQINTINGKK